MTQQPATGLPGSVVNQEASSPGNLISLLHLLPIGLLFLDERHQVLLCNEMAKRITQAAKPLFVGTDGVIALTNPRGHADFSAFLRSVFAADCPDRKYAVHLVMRPNPAVPIAIIAVRCDGCVIAQKHPGRQALLCLRDTMLFPPFDATTLQELFGYTPAERGLVTALMSGMTLREHAETRGIGENTVRTQLKAVLAKTGLHRQSDLVRVLGSI
jgi:DNA-binding CsgD family transcriptional regulator